MHKNTDVKSVQEFLLTHGRRQRVQLFGGPFDGIEVELEVNALALVLPISPKIVEDPQRLVAVNDRTESLTSAAKYEVGLFEERLCYYFAGSIDPSVLSR